MLDRSLGSIQVPALLRAAGLRLHTLVDVYGSPADEDVLDHEWLSLAGQRRWPVLMKDQRIRYRPAERAVVIANGVQAFCLSSGNLKAAVMADQFLSRIDRIADACGTSGPALYSFQLPACDRSRWIPRAFRDSSSDHERAKPRGPGVLATSMQRQQVRQGRRAVDGLRGLQPLRRRPRESGHRSRATGGSTCPGSRPRWRDRAGPGRP